MSLCDACSEARSHPHFRVPVQFVLPVALRPRILHLPDRYRRLGLGFCRPSLDSTASLRGHARLERVGCVLFPFIFSVIARPRDVTISWLS